MSFTVGVWLKPLALAVRLPQSPGLDSLSGFREDCLHKSAGYPSGQKSARYSNSLVSVGFSIAYEIGK